MDNREKQIAYGEGVVHGFEVAQSIVERLSQGHLTLNRPEAIGQWDRRVRRLRDHQREEDEQRREAQKQG